MQYHSSGCELFFFQNGSSSAQKINLLKITDEEVLELMDLSEMYYNDFSSGDEFNDPEFISDDFCLEGNKCISQFILVIIVTLFLISLKPFDLSLDASNLPTTSSTTLVEESSATVYAKEATKNVVFFLNNFYYIITSMTQS